ncbi:MAG: glycoside hydrolase family 140 protein [Bacteroidia bacterium]
MRILLPLLWLILPALACAPSRMPFDLPPLVVSADGRFLLQASPTGGRPFFYLGDTAWELFHRLSREEADTYLQDRAAKGFTVIQAVVLAELDGLQTPNAYGQLPLTDFDPTRPNEAYFEHVDWITRRAASLGLYIGMLPTWGDKWNKRWGVGPEIFTPEHARTYGEWLGRRYRDRSNIIWIMGGDRIPETDTHRAIIHAMAEGVRQGDGGTHLMTFHPMGTRNSAEFFHDQPWLSFNMVQSGHGSERDGANYTYQRENYARTPAKPTLDGEPRYEDHPAAWRPEELGWYDAADVRRAAYWGLLAGACGTTYGNHNIWQMWQPGRAPIAWARTSWRQALHHEGSEQMAYLRRVFESRPWQRLVPDSTLVLSDNPRDGAHVLAARSQDGDFAFAYTPQGRPVRLDLQALKGEQLRTWCFNPRDGLAWELGTFPRDSVPAFEPPARGRGSDWLLVVEDAARGYGPPGIVP